MGEKKEKKKDKKEKKDKEKKEKKKKKEEKATVRSAPDGSDNYLDLPIALVSLWVPPAPGIVPEFNCKSFSELLRLKAHQLLFQAGRI